MRLGLVYYNVVEQSAVEQELEVSRDLSLQDLLDRGEYPNGEVDLSRYYAVHDGYSTFAPIFPYLCVGGHTYWHVAYSEAHIADIVDTLRLGAEPLRVNVGIPQAGGPGVVDLATLWDRFYEVLKAVDPLIGVGSGFVGLGVWIRSRLRRLNRPISMPRLEAIPPGAVFSFVVARPEWKASQLADELGVTREDAINLLRLCRYRWTPRGQTYFQTDDTRRIVRALNEAEQYDTS